MKLELKILLEMKRYLILALVGLVINIFGQPIFKNAYVVQGQTVINSYRFIADDNVYSFYSNKKAYIDMDTANEYAVSNYELCMNVYFDDNAYHFFNTHYQLNSNANISVYYFANEIYISQGGSNYRYAMYPNQVNEFIIKYYNGNLYLTVNDTVRETGTPASLATSTGYPTFIFARNASSKLAPEGYLFKCEFYELNTSGQRISQLIKLDLKQTTGDFVGNIGLNAPTNGTVIPNGQTIDTWWVTNPILP